MTDLTKLTVDQLRAEILTPENGVTFAEATNELARRAQANDLVQAERDEFDEELHTCRAIVRATSEHLHVDLEEMVDKLRRTEADAHSWQELATARAQANDALRSAAQWVATAERDLQASALVNDGLFNAKLEQLQERCGDLRQALAAAPAPSSSGAPAPADPWTPVQCDYDRNIHANPDANAWADFFVQVHPGLADKHDLMRAWFANAMMAMHDSPRCKPAPGDGTAECQASTEGAKVYLHALVARRVAEARGAGLRELRARLVDFCRIRDRGYDVRSDFSPLWVLDEIDRLLAAPPASKLAEEPAQEDDGPCLSALLANMRMEMSDGANGMRTPREEAIAAVVECVARRIEALENNKEAGK